MIRNSVDHGIEKPEERVKAGKPETAQVTLEAFHRGRHICIQVRDDGKGVDVERVRAKIVERELASPQEAERMHIHVMPASVKIRPSGWASAREDCLA